MPLFLCCALLVRCRKNFYYRKAMPQTKAWLRVSPLCKKIHCHATNLVGCRAFLREKIMLWFFPSSGFVEWYLPNICLKLVERISTKDVCAIFCHALVPLPCPFDCSQHLNFWVIQQVLNKQPCHPYMFLSCVALHGSCAKNGVDWSCEWK